MPNREWAYSTNTFLSSHMRNFIKMEMVTEDFLSRISLSTVPEIVVIKTDFMPYRQSYHNKFIEWDTAIDNGIGKTKTYNDLLDALSSHQAAEIHAAVMNVLHKGTPEFIAVFPHGVSPLQKGKFTERINEVEKIKNKIMAYPALAATVALLSMLYLQLIDAQAKHHSAQKDIQDRSDELNILRVEIAEQLFKNLGKLITLYFKNPEKIENFFNLKLIRQVMHDAATDAEKFIFTTDQSTLKQITITLKGTAGKTIEIDWDDGDVEQYVLTGGDQTIHHDYNQNRSYDIRIGGATGELTKLTLNMCNLINFAWTKGEGIYKLRDLEVAYNSLTHMPSLEGLTDLNYVNIKENNIIANDLNRTLVIVNESGISGGTFHADGPDMSAPTGEGLAAKNALIARGWTVVTN